MERRRERDQIADTQNALVCTLIANNTWANADPKTRKKKPFSVDDFRVIQTAKIVATAPKYGEAARKVREMFAIYQAKGVSMNEVN